MIEIKEAIELIEDSICHVQMIQSNYRKLELVIYRADILVGGLCRKQGILHQALAKLRTEQPLASEFTKECCEIVTKFEEEGITQPDDCYTECNNLLVRTMEKLKKACVIVDHPKANQKELHDALSHIKDVLEAAIKRPKEIAVDWKEFLITNTIEVAIKSNKEGEDVMIDNYNKKPIRVKHSKLNRSDDSLFRSICPVCKDGILHVTRDSKTLQIVAEDSCLSCGQRFIYEDYEDIETTFKTTQ